MCYLYLFLLLVFCAILWILISPIRLIIDTKKEQYQLYWKGVAGVALKSSWRLHWNIFWWQQSTSLEHLQLGNTSKGKSNKIAKWSNWRRGLRLLKTFEVKDCHLELDTDNYVWNAYLYPILHLIKPLGSIMKINYEGKFECKLVIENRLSRILYAIIIPSN